MTQQNPFQIKKASKQNTRLKMALIGISGSGKTYSALSIGSHLGRRILLVDTEHGSASKYADEFDFDVIELDNFSPTNYVECINLAQREGYDVLVIDSLSHAWTGKGGALEMVDNAAKRQNGNSFGAWRNVTPLHNELIDSIVGARLHLIATMRAKTEYSQDKDERGRTVVRKIGMAPVQRDQMEYEFDIVGDMDQEHNLIITKSRCRALADQVIARPGQQVAQTLLEWLQASPAQSTPPSPEEVAQLLAQGLIPSGSHKGKEPRDVPTEVLEAVLPRMNGKPAFALLKQKIEADLKSREVAEEIGEATWHENVEPQTIESASTQQSSTPAAPEAPAEEPHPLDDVAVKDDALFYDIPPGTPKTSCSKCGADMYFVTTKKGGAMPVNPDGSPHWANCPNAKEFRKPKTETPKVEPAKNPYAVNVFAAINKAELPMEPREVRIAAANVFLRENNFAAIQSFQQLRQGEATALALAIKLKKLTWDAQGNITYEGNRYTVGVAQPEMAGVA